jgi:hypothetical protein
MKRGLITWDKSEIPPEVLQNRLNQVRRVLNQRGLPALVVYSDMWRSNQARFFSNFMPYFNRGLLIIPGDAPPILLCGLSPRVYGWIRSVTIVEDVRPAGNFAKPLFEIARERNWARLGALDLERFPYDIHKALQGGAVGVENVESDAVFAPENDATERIVRRKAAAMAAQILEAEIKTGAGLTDHVFVGNLERLFRKSGAEDLVILVTNGRAVPAPPSGAILEAYFSVSIALEYRGHWIRLSRYHGDVKPTEPALESCSEHLDGCYPYESGRGKMQIDQFEFKHRGKRLFYGGPDA